MRVKTFRAETAARALELVKRELGPEAVILGNRRIAGAAPHEAVFEVTAAFDQTDDEEPGAVGDLRTDLREIRGFLSLLLSSRDGGAGLAMREPAREVYHELLARGVGEREALSLLAAALESLGEAEAGRGALVQGLSRVLLSRVGVLRPFSPEAVPPASGAAFSFLGPTGVGKTTTLAKLAAYLKLRRGLDVAVISLDTYRIGAVEQLRTYASLLGVAFASAQGPEEFRALRERFGNRDVVLIDTTGRNYLGSRGIRALEEAFSGGAPVRHFLVLPATAKDDDLRETALRFRALPIHSLIFTKLDETLTPGGCLSQALRSPWPVSYFATGQRVPEDIEAATHRRMLGFLFPASGKERHVGPGTGTA